MPRMAEQRALSEVVREARQRRNLGLNQAAQLAKVRKDWLSRIESGEIRRPRDLDKLKRLARVLRVRPEVLLEAAGRLTASEKAASGQTLSVVEAIEASHLTSGNKRLLIDMYRTLAGEADGR